MQRNGLIKEDRLIIHTKYGQYDTNVHEMIYIQKKYSQNSLA